MTAPRDEGFDGIDHRHMADALQLARRGNLTCRPNPKVGCVIARGVRVLGRGWHARAGGAHAEVVALGQAGEEARGATAYVTLEPCAHTGRTPPCVDALLAAGVARVVVAHEDPFPEVDGRGLARLRAAGVAVACGLMREQAYELNKGFFMAVRCGRPWMRVKMGMSADGRTALADGRSQWITGLHARADVQRWRARSCAILTGVGTVLADDPALLVRDHSPESFVAPVRVVLDSHARMGAGARIGCPGAPTLAYHRQDVCPAGMAGIEWVAAPTADGRLDLAWVVGDLARRGMREVQVEAGARLCGGLVAAGLVDEMLIYMAPTLLGHDSRPLLEMTAPSSLDVAPGFDIADVALLEGDLQVRMVRRGVIDPLP